MLKVNDVRLADRISVPTERKLTDAGQMHVPCKFARTGTQLYTAKQLGLADLDDNEVVEVHREAADVFATDSMDSFRSAPVTIGHPKNAEGKAIQVSAENAKDLQVGMLEGMPVQDEETLGGVLVLTDQAAIDALEDGTQELSAGYICDIEDVDGKYFQRNIRANHIAIVAKGRAGSSCRISDAALDIQDGAIQAAEDQKVAEEAEAKRKEAAKPAKKKAKEKTVVVDLTDELAVQVKLVDEMTAEIESLKVELADAKTAAEQDVVARCAAIENARLISDFRDLGDKTVEQIERMVVEDQMPEKDLASKSDVYVSAMFEILVDASKGETPMGKLMKAQSVVDAAPKAKPMGKVAAAREAAILRSKNLSK